MMIHKTKDQNITADPDLSWLTDASADSNFVWLCNLTEQIYKTGVSFKLIKQWRWKKNHLASCLSEAFDDREQKSRGHVETSSKQWHLQKECGTWVIMLSWCMFNKLYWQEGKPQKSNTHWKSTEKKRKNKDCCTHLSSFAIVKKITLSWDEVTVLDKAPGILLTLCLKVFLWTQRASRGNKQTWGVSLKADGGQQNCDTSLRELHWISTELKPLNSCCMFSIARLFNSGTSTT